MSCLSTPLAGLVGNGSEGGNSHMVHSVMKKNWGKVCTTYQRGQRVSLLTVDLDRVHGKKMCKKEHMGADEVGWSNLLPLLSSEHVFKGLWLLCFTEKHPYFLSDWKCKVIVTAHYVQSIRFTMLYVLGHLKFRFSHRCCYLLLEPYTLSILMDWQSSHGWFVCFPCDFYALNSPGCASNLNSMKARDSQSTTLSHALELCELVLIWCFPVIIVSPACWELCFGFLPNAWNSLNW